jgi:hypothetical protein
MASWLEIQERAFEPLPDPPASTPGKFAVAQIQSLLSTSQPLSALTGLTSSSGAIALLPVMLYYHDNLQQLQQQLKQSVLPANKTESIPLLSLGNAIALALQNRLNPIDSTDAKNNFDISHPIFFALQIFVTTPEDFRLTLLQSARTSPDPQTTCAIAGALSGAFNSLAGIPMAWRQRLLADTSDRSPLFQLWQLNAEADLFQLADQLLAAWSGVYNPLHWLEQANVKTVTAIPHVIRPR